MNSNYTERQHVSKSKFVLYPSLKIKYFCIAVLTLLLAVNILAAAPASALHVFKGPKPQAATLSFTAVTDAFVEELHPNSNSGTSDYLLVENANNRTSESYVRFTVSGLTGTVQSAKLRLYTTANSTTNGPAVYTTSNSWTETDITWNNRPARTSNAIDNKGAVDKNTWVEYDVTSMILGNGTFNFVLAGDSSDEVRFSAREGSNPPQLVLTFNSSPPTATRTSTPAFTRTPTRTPTGSSGTTVTATVVGPTATSTSGSGSTLTFTTNADARVVQDSPTTNYGTSTNLQADGDSGIAQTSYIRFTTSGLNSPIQSVKLRVFCTTNGTANGPAVYLANSTWTESGSGGITWNTQPALLSGVVDNKGSIGTNSWVEYDVTSLVTVNGTYTFALVADSNDGVTFSSREGTASPQLVVTFGTGASSSTRTPTPIPTQVNSPTPTAGPTSSGSVTLVGAGDISSCTNNNDEATAKLLDGIPGTVFVAGDNAYIDGSLADYNNCYDPTWGRHKARTKPVPGNHEYQTSGAAGYFQYFNNVASYYAYDLGSWRIYALNSEISVSATSAQVTWLQDDLAANPRQCVLAYWHKPRWSSGSNHGSNSAMQTLWQTLSNAGAELVLNGHEHNYERFSEMNASGAAVSQGLREIVIGTGGVGLYPFGSALATSQVRNNSSYGVLKITLNSTGYSWQFVPIAGSTFTDSGSDTCH